jgi:hypothetical protein
MPRTARACSAGYTYHILNCGNGRAEVFRKPADDDAFLEIMAKASRRTPLGFGRSDRPTSISDPLTPRATPSTV